MKKRNFKMQKGCTYFLIFAAKKDESVHFFGFTSIRGLRESGAAYSNDNVSFCRSVVCRDEIV